VIRSSQTFLFFARAALVADFSSARSLNDLAMCGPIYGANKKRTRSQSGRSIREVVKDALEQVFIGSVTKVGEHPWHASISNAQAIRYDFCGATLISKRFLVTGILCFLSIFFCYLN